MQAVLTWAETEPLDSNKLAEFLTRILGDLKTWTVICDFERLGNTVELLIAAGAGRVKTGESNVLNVVNYAEFSEWGTRQGLARDVFLCVQRENGDIESYQLQDYSAWAQTPPATAALSTIYDQEIQHCWASIEPILTHSLSELDMEVIDEQAETAGRVLGRKIGELVDRKVRQELSKLGLTAAEDILTLAQHVTMTTKDLTETINQEFRLERELKELDEVIGKLEKRLVQATPLQVAMGYTEPHYFLILRFPVFYKPMEIRILTQPEIAGFPSGVVMAQDIVYVPTKLVLRNIQSEGYVSVYFQQTQPDSRSQVNLTIDPFRLSHAYLSSLENIDLGLDFPQLEQEQLFLQAFSRLCKDTLRAQPPYKQALLLFQQNPAISPEDALQRLLSS